MDGFELDVLKRLPLGEAVLTILQFIWDEDELRDLFDEHRGTGSEIKVSFPLLVNLVLDAIVEHRGSGRESFHQARVDGRLDASDGALYGKLRRTPVRLSEAFLRETTRRVQQLLPDRSDDVVIPSALRDYRVLIVDGKKLKKLPKRLKPLREVSGKVLGGKVVVGMLLNDGLVVAMHASPDGEANDAPLTPGLMEQAETASDQRTLVVADRQFCDLKIPHRIINGQNDFVIRYSKKMRFYVEKERELKDHQGRIIREAWGMLGRQQDARRMYLRQITLHRPGEEDVILVTNLLDAETVPAQQLLDVYLQRWSIERVFQQVTEVFHLQELIGTSPRGAIFQFSLCTCLYNVIQVVRQHLAHVHHRPPESLSSEMIFRDVSKQLTAATQFIARPELMQCIPQQSTARQVCRRLTHLLADQWSDLWNKCPPKKRQPKRQETRVPGGHSSAFKLIQNPKPP